MAANVPPLARFEGFATELERLVALWTAADASGASLVEPSATAFFRALPVYTGLLLNETSDGPLIHQCILRIVGLLAALVRIPKAMSPQVLCPTE